MTAVDNNNEHAISNYVLIHDTYITMYHNYYLHT